jgi:hypothetical protein
MDIITRIFTYNTPNPDNEAKFVAIREAALELARVISDNAPACRDRDAAIRHVRDAVYTANASIALDGLV